MLPPEIWFNIYQYCSPKDLGTLAQTSRFMNHLVNYNTKFLNRPLTITYHVERHLLFEYPELYTVFPQELIKYMDLNTLWKQSTWFKLVATGRRVDGKLYLEGPFEGGTDTWSVSGCYRQGCLEGRYGCHFVSLNFHNNLLEGPCHCFDQQLTTHWYHQGKKHGLELVWNYTEPNLSNIPVIITISEAKQALEVHFNGFVLVDFNWIEDGTVYRHGEQIIRRKVRRGNVTKKYQKKDLYEQIKHGTPLEVSNYNAGSSNYNPITYHNSLYYPFPVTPEPKEYKRTVYYQRHKIVYFFTNTGKLSYRELYRWDGRLSELFIKYM